MAHQDQDSGNRPFHREGSEIIFDKPEDHEENARKTRENEQHEFQRAQVKANRRIAAFTGILVFATFCTIAVGVWQNRTSEKAANAARDAAVASQEANETTRKLFQASFLIESPQLRFDRGQLSIPTRNVGKAIARNVAIEGQITVKPTLSKSAPLVAQNKREYPFVPPDNYPDGIFWIAIPNIQPSIWRDDASASVMPQDWIDKIVKVEVRISYDAGFGERDQQYSCRLLVVDEPLKPFRNPEIETYPCSDEAYWIARRRKQVLARKQNP